MHIPLPAEVSRIEDLAGPLDAATHAERLAWMRRVPMKQFWTLFDLAEGQQVGLEDLVYSDGRPRIHEGMNTAPPFRRFEKRFARVGDTVVGYNQARGLGRAVVWFQGYGPFVAKASPEREGEIWVDYRELPPQHPDFPPVRPIKGTNYVVYGDMIDVVRRVSRDVTIGDTAVKGFSVGLGAKFMLVRQP